MISCFPKRRGACLSSIVHNKSQNWFSFSADVTSDALEGSSINN